MTNRSQRINADPKSLYFSARINPTGRVRVFSDSGSVERFSSRGGWVIIERRKAVYGRLDEFIRDVSIKTGMKDKDFDSIKCFFYNSEQWILPIGHQIIAISEKIFIIIPLSGQIDLIINGWPREQ
jgi:hypothetical protein